MRGLPLLVVLLAAVPLAAAEPLFAAPEDAWTMAFYGLARQGSSDANGEWLLWGSPVCIQVLGYVRVRLELLTGGPLDVLRLDVPGVGVAEARLGAPAYLEGVQGDPCPDFVVHGAALRDLGVYRVSASGEAL